MPGNPAGPSGVSDAVAGRPRDERQLVDRSRAGDVRAYEELVRLHQPIAFRTAVVLTGSSTDAEEAVQDAFVKAWAAMPRFRPDAPFRPWLLTIVANEARSRRRAVGRRRRWTERAVHDPQWIRPGSSPSAESAVLASERRATLVRALRELPPPHRAVIELRYLLDLSEEEMAGVLRCRPGTVKSRLSRALDRLRGEIGSAS